MVAELYRQIYILYIYIYNRVLSFQNCSHNITSDAVPQTEQCLHWSNIWQRSVSLTRRVIQSGVGWRPHKWDLSYMSFRFSLVAFRDGYYCCDMATNTEVFIPRLWVDSGHKCDAGLMHLMHPLCYYIAWLRLDTRRFTEDWLSSRQRF